MKRRNYITLVLLVIVIVLAGVAFLLTREKTCNPYINIGEKRDIKSCECLEDLAERQKCEANISGVDSYTQAAQNSDLSACDDITVPEMKTACIKVVQGKIDFAKKANQ